MALDKISYLYARREWMGLSIEGMAGKCGCDRIALGKYERDPSCIRIRRLAMLAKGYEIPQEHVRLFIDDPLVKDTLECKEAARFLAPKQEASK